MKLEEEILTRAKNAIYDSITKVFTEYHNPLKTLVTNVVEENKEALEKLVSKSFKNMIEGKNFQSEMETIMTKKLAQALLSQTGSEVQSVIDKINQKNPVLKQEIEVAVSKLIKKYQD